MSRLRAKTFQDPDETRTVPGALLRVVNLGEVAIGHALWQPGWRWSTDLRPIAGTEWCENHHLGYALSGQLAVVTEAGEQIEVRAGSVYEIPPRHDAWVVGDEPFETVEWSSARVVGVESEAAGGRVLATVLFTDIVDSTATLERVGDPGLAGAAPRPQRADPGGDQRVPRSGGRHDRRRVPGRLRQRDARRAMRGRHGARGRAARDRGSASGSTPARSSSSPARFAASLSTPRPGCWPSPGAGEVVVSATTRDLAEGSGLTFVDAGLHALKGLSGERQVYRVAR